MFTLNLLPIGESARIVRLTSVGSQRRRMQELGFINSTTVKALCKSPCGGAVAYQVRGTVIALRNQDAEKIICERGVEA